MRRTRGWRNMGARGDEESRQLSSLAGTRLFAVVCDGRQDGAQRLHAHGDVQQVAGEEEVVVMAQ